MDTLTNLRQAEADFQKLVESIKGLSKLSRHNQKLLLEKLGVDETKEYIRVSTGLLKNKTYMCNYNETPLYIHQSLGLGISRDPKRFQLTDHTLYTFCNEFSIKPSEFLEHKNG